MPLHSHLALDVIVLGDHGLSRQQLDCDLGVSILHQLGHSKAALAESSQLPEIVPVHQIRAASRRLSSLRWPRQQGKDICMTE